MRWGKIVLLFQAIVTLILGMVFLSQVIDTDFQKVTEIIINTDQEQQSQKAIEIMEIKKQYTYAAYILIFVALMELIIITQFLSIV